MEKRNKKHKWINKSRFLLFAFIMLSLGGKAQIENVIHVGKPIYIGNVTPDVYIMGSFETQDDTFGVSNMGVFHIQGDLINNGAKKVFGDAPNAGTVRFFGGTPADSATISGDSVNMNNLIIDLDNSALFGNVLLRTGVLTTYGNDSFLMGGFDLGTNALNLFYTMGSNGITAESDSGRPLLLNRNYAGHISLINYPWQDATNYTNVHGMGLSFYLDDPIGVAPVLTRTFYPQLCGDSIGHIGSIERVYRMENNDYNAKFRSTGINFLTPELAGNPYGDSLLIFVSLDKSQSWRQIQFNTGDEHYTTSAGTSLFSIPQNYTVITAATNPCDNLPPIQINQIITSITPNDTLEDISEILVCDASNVSARLFATGDYGAYFEWRKNSGYYLPQDVGYYDINSLGTYWVRMTTVRGCTDSVALAVNVETEISSEINASDDQICLGDSVFFKPEVYESTATYEWDFGDGTIITADSIYHTFSSVGNFTVKLKAISVNNCMSSSTAAVNVFPIPVASFTAGTACPLTPIAFTNTTVVNYPSTMVDLTWSFGDGSPDSIISYNNLIPASANVYHSYPNDTTYTITLTAISNHCSSDTVTQTITIYPLPAASFTYSPACEGNSITFTNTSTISDLTPMDYQWDFNAGVGPYSITENPVYTYNYAGTDTVSLIAYSIHGCSDTIFSGVTVNENPVINFTGSDVCVFSPASFVSSISQGTSPYTYAWNFGDGNLGTQSSESNIYNVAGTYNVSLIVYTDDSCTASISHSILIYPAPSVSFSVMNNCVNLPINFINTSSNSSTYTWNFPDLALTSTLQNPTVTYDIDGTFPVYLTAVSSNNCSATDTGYVTIYPEPVLNLGDYIQTCGSSYILYADTVYTGNNYVWSTGDITPQYNVTHNGTFSVTVTSPYSCISTDNVEVILNEEVLPVLGPDSVFCDYTVLDAGYTSPSTVYVWSTGDNTETIDVFTSDIYSVTVTDQNGCIGSSSINITIYPSTPVSLGPPDTSACDYENMTLDAGLAAGYLWSDGSTLSTLEVNTSGYYWVRTLNGAGCSSSDTIYVTIETSPSASLGSDIIACDQTPIGVSNSIYDYSWNTGDTIPSITVFASGEYSITVTNNINLCRSSDTINVTINPLPIVDLGNDTVLCSYQSVTIDAGNAGSFFQWESGETTQTITVSSEGQFNVVVTDNNGCSSNGDIIVDIRPVFTIELGPDKQYCPGSTLILDAGLTTTGNQYLWEYSGSVIASTETYSVSDTGMYYLTVIDSYSCLAMDSARVFPSNTSLFAVFLSDSRISAGDTVMFVNLSYPKPYLSNWYLDNVLVSNDSCPVIAFTMPVNYPEDTIYAKLNITNEFCVSELSKPIIVTSSIQPAIPIDIEIEKEPKEELNPDILQLKLFPNPNDGSFNLYTEVNGDILSSIRIYNIAGVQVYKERRILTNSLISYNFNDLAPGMYFLTIETETEKHTIKFLKTPE